MERKKNKSITSVVGGANPSRPAGKVTEFLLIKVERSQFIDKIIRLE